MHLQEGEEKLYLNIQTSWSHQDSLDCSIRSRMIAQSTKEGCQLKQHEQNILMKILLYNIEW